MVEPEEDMADMEEDTGRAHISDFSQVSTCVRSLKLHFERVSYK